MKKIFSLMIIMSLLSALSATARPVSSQTGRDASLRKEERRPVVFEQTEPTPRTRKKSTVPIIVGVLAAGAVVAAVLILSKDKNKEDEAEKTPAVFRQGQFTVQGTCYADLDLGQQVPNESIADFFWEQETYTERYLTPMNGARFFVVGSVDFNNLTYQQLKGYAYSNAKISGSDGAANKLPNGTVVAAITNEGRYCKFRVDSGGYNLTITFLTFDKK